MYIQRIKCLRAGTVLLSQLVQLLCEVQVKLALA